MATYTLIVLGLLVAITGPTFISRKSRYRQAATLALRLLGIALIVSAFIVR